MKIFQVHEHVVQINISANFLTRLFFKKQKKTDGGGGIAALVEDKKM